MSVQPDFLEQKCEIEEKITAFFNGFYHQVVYYPKFHCELNHIEHFWSNSKDYARLECDYTLNRLQKHVPEALTNVKILTFLGCYNWCWRKMQLYREGIAYGFSKWVKKTSHQKINTPGTEQWMRTHIKRYGALMKTVLRLKSDDIMLFG